jgi:hypothetical protein
MLISYYAARANLSYLHQQHPHWSHAELATALGCSESWVEKWLKRWNSRSFDDASREDLPTPLFPIDAHHAAESRR